MTASDLTFCSVSVLQDIQIRPVNLYYQKCFLKKKLLYHHRSYYKQELDSWHVRGKKTILYLLRVHVELLPSHGYLLISLCSFATHGKKKDTPVISCSFTKPTTSGWASFNSYFGYFYVLLHTQDIYFLLGRKLCHNFKFFQVIKDLENYTIINGTV